MVTYFRYLTTVFCRTHLSSLLFEKMYPRLLVVDKKRYQDISKTLKSKAAYRQRWLLHFKRLAWIKSKTIVAIME